MCISSSIRIRIILLRIQIKFQPGILVRIRIHPGGKSNVDPGPEHYF